MKLFKNFISTCLFLGYFFFTHAQNPILLEDYNPGLQPISSTFYNSLQVGDVIYFVGDVSARRDLYAIKDNKIIHIDTLCQTFCQSHNSIFFEYKDKLYYVKQTIFSTPQLRCTDGTHNNNELILEYNGRFDSYVEGNNNKLYLGLSSSSTNKREIYISDGSKNGTKIINPDLNLGTSEFRFGKPIPYGNGIAFANTLNDSLRVFSYNEDSLSLLGKIRLRPGGGINGLNSINNDDLVILSQSDNSLISEVYRFDNSSKTISKELTLPYERFKFPLLFPFSNDSLILYHFNGGHHIISGSPLEKTNLTPYYSDSYSSYLEQFHNYNGKLAYVAFQDATNFLGPAYLVLFDGDINEKKEFEIIDRFPSIISLNQYVLAFSNSSSGREGNLSILNLDTEEFKELYRFNQSFSMRRGQPLGIIGNKIYFLAMLNMDIGREVYYIESDLISSTNETVLESSPSFELMQRGRKFSVKNKKDENKNYTLEIFDTSGRQIYTSLISSDIEYNFIDKITGLVMVRVRDNSSYLAKSYPIFLH